MKNKILLLLFGGVLWFYSAQVLDHKGRHVYKVCGIIGYDKFKPIENWKSTINMLVEDSNSNKEYTEANDGQNFTDKNIHLISFNRVDK